eukprot:14686-Ditylum_brightwellii.AAC.1
MVHVHNCVQIDGTVLFHGVDDNADGADKHLAHLSQGVDCHFTWRSKQDAHVVGNKDDDVDNGVEDSVDNGDDNSVEDGVD